MTVCCTHISKYKKIEKNHKLKTTQTEKIKAISVVCPPSNSWVNKIHFLYKNLKIQKNRKKKFEK